MAGHFLMAFDDGVETGDVDIPLSIFCTRLTQFEVARGHTFTSTDSRITALTSMHNPQMFL